jgi:hypothetical protein
VAPGANILLVQAASTDPSDLMTAVNWARQQPGVSVVSMSRGYHESSSFETVRHRFHHAGRPHRNHVRGGLGRHGGVDLCVSQRRVPIRRGLAGGRSNGPVRGRSDVGGQPRFPGARKGVTLPLLVISGLATGPPAGVGEGLRFLSPRWQHFCPRWGRFVCLNPALLGFV